MYLLCPNEKAKALTQEPRITLKKTNYVKLDQPRKVNPAIWNNLKAIIEMQFDTRDTSAQNRQLLK